MSANLLTPASPSPVSDMSTSVRIHYPANATASLACRATELSAFGEISRLDVSLSNINNCVLVTYFDVRSAQRALSALGSAANPFPGAAHDFRSVSIGIVMLPAFMATVGGFRTFGEVAGVSRRDQQLFVEYFDARAAQKVISVSSLVEPSFVSDLQQAAVFNHNLGDFPAAPGLQSNLLSNDTGLLFPNCCMNVLAEVIAGDGPRGAGPLGNNPPFSAEGCKAASDGTGVSNIAGLAPMVLGGGAISGTLQPEQTIPPPPGLGGSPVGKAAAVSPQKSIASTDKEDISAYDVQLKLIRSGKDTRTTVMLRNISKACSREAFVKLLEACDLGDRYTFLYLPYNRRLKLGTGFAFVNFLAPEDVLKFFLWRQRGGWQQLLGDSSGLPPALSYARLQGHDELMKHFNQSAVMNAQDEDTRPLFYDTKAIEQKEAGRDEDLVLTDTEDFVEGRQQVPSTCGIAFGGPKNWRNQKHSRRHRTEHNAMGAAY